MLDQRRRRKAKRQYLLTWKVSRCCLFAVNVSVAVPHCECITLHFRNVRLFFWIAGSFSIYHYLHIYSVLWHFQLFFWKLLKPKIWSNFYVWLIAFWPRRLYLWYHTLISPYGRMAIDQIYTPLVSVNTWVYNHSYNHGTILVFTSTHYLSIF